MIEIEITFSVTVLIIFSIVGIIASKYLFLFVKTKSM